MKNVASVVRPQRFRSDGWLLIVLPTTAFLCVFFLYPVATVVGRSFNGFDFNLANYGEVFTNSIYRKVLLNTVTMAGLTTIACLLLGYPYAYLMVRAGEARRNVLLLCVIVPFWTSLLVRTFAWVLLLADKGLINKALLWAHVIDSPLSLIRTMPGVVIGMSHILLPYFIMPLYAQMKKIDLSLLKAAESLGAPPHKAFWKVFFPLSLSGVISSATLVFLLALGFYVTPALLGSGSTLVMGEMIVQQISGVLNWGVGSALAIVLLVLTLALLAGVARSSRAVIADEGRV